MRREVGGDERKRGKGRGRRERKGRIWVSPVAL